MATIDLNSLVAGEAQPQSEITYQAKFDRFESKDLKSGEPDGTFMSGYVIRPMLGDRPARGSRLFVRFATDKGNPKESQLDSDAASRLRSAAEAAIAFAAKCAAQADKIDPPAKKAADKGKAAPATKPVTEDDLAF